MVPNLQTVCPFFLCKRPCGLYTPQPASKIKDPAGFDHCCLCTAMLISPPAVMSRERFCNYESELGSKYSSGETGFFLQADKCHQMLSEALCAGLSISGTGAWGYFWSQGVNAAHQSEQGRSSPAHDLFQNGSVCTCIQSLHALSAGCTGRWSER